MEKNILTNLNDEFLNSRKKIAFCNCSYKKKLMVYGSKSLGLINRYSIRRIDSNMQATYTVFIKKKKVICEALVIKISSLRYIIICEESYKLNKLLDKAKKKYALTTVEDVSNDYSLFSFHGDEANNYFNDKKYNGLYFTKHQNYSYYQMLIERSHEQETIQYFMNINLIPISIATKRLFLYNNNVITNINRVNKKYLLNVIKIIYPYDNYLFKVREKLLAVYQYEAQSNCLIMAKDPIYNHKRRKVGIVYCSFKLPNKVNPYIIAIVKKYKVNKIALLKIGNKEIIIKQNVNYK